MKPVSAIRHDEVAPTCNPLRGLTMERVVSELEAGQRGEYSNLQWLYQFIEKRDATLRGAKRRIISSILKLDWNIKIQAGLSEADAAVAEKQAQKLKRSYGKATGLRAALRHMALAEFRGFAHVEKLFSEDGELLALHPVPQWHFCRDGCYGKWLYKENANQWKITGVPIQPGNFIIREIEDPINEIALIAFTRKSLSSKDFDSFIARYGIPFVYWILSDSMSAALAADPSKLNEWMAIMRGIGADGEGIFPGGQLETLDSSFGSKEQNPFLQHLGYQDEQIVMAATSGKLTMLNDATGLGSGNANAHQRTFDEIALAIAKEISETFHDQIDIPLLENFFPGSKPLCYFELAAKNSVDVGRMIENVKILDEAGWQIDESELKEKTGLNLHRSTPTHT